MVFNAGTFVIWSTGAGMIETLLLEELELTNVATTSLMLTEPLTDNTSIEEYLCV